MTTDKMKKLMELCKCEVSITVNEHKNSYQSVLDCVGFNPDDLDDIPEDVLKTMCDTDTMIRVQAYSRTAVGFYLCHHYDLESALDIVIGAVERGQ
jgi:hypothetical protein